MRSGIKDFIEYTLARILLGIFGLMPRRIACLGARLIAWLGFRFARRQRMAGLHNLRMALPELSDQERYRILGGCFRNLGRLLVEFSRFSTLNKANIGNLVYYDGLENYHAALQRGRGVIFLTGHFGSWELSAFAHSIFGYPMKFVVRPIDNARVDQLITHYRTLGGNIPIQRRSTARDILQSLRHNEVVGILFDQNTTRSEGVFADFFGIPAATTSAIATLALRTGAAVIPGFLIWEEKLGRHRLRFDPPVELVETGDPAHDVVENTRAFNRILEGYIRKHPDQWLWIHRRWKTRPEGEKSLYP